MTSLWEVPNMKRQTMPTEAIEETTTVGVPEIGEIVNQEMKTELLNLGKLILPIHQHLKRSSMSPTLKKPCESSWSLKNHRTTLSKISSSILKPKSSKYKRITKLRFRILRPNLVDSPTNVPLDQLHVNAIFTRSGLTYDLPVNPNAKTTVIHDDSEDEVDESEKEVESFSSKQTKYDPPPLKAYKPKIPYPQLLRKEKMEEHYAKFIDLIKEVRINVPLVDVLADMPNYGKFLKDLLPPKLVDPESFLIPCTVAGSVEYLALADLGASINLMPYSLYASLSGNTLKPTRMSIRLANHTFQYPMRIVENMLVQVRKFVFLADLVILQMEEDDKVPLILGRPFLHTDDAIIRVKNKELNLGVRDDRITFLIDKAMQPYHSNDDTCFRMDVIDEVTEEELDALLDESKPFSTTSEKISESSLDHEFEEFMAIKIEEFPKQEEEVEDNFKELPLEENLRMKKSIQDPPTNLVMKPLP
ncbi:reverse transcriptase domain-containing protein [Tanacetum coccineum]